MQDTFEASQRTACRVIGQPRSTQRYAVKRRDDEALIVRRMHELIRTRPRFGYRRIGALLRDEGFVVNRKRVWRLWKREGFKVPQKQRKKWRLGCSANGIVRHRTEHKDHVWAWDFKYLSHDSLYSVEPEFDSPHPLHVVAVGRQRLGHRWQSCELRQSCVRLTPETVRNQSRDQFGIRAATSFMTSH